MRRHSGTLVVVVGPTAVGKTEVAAELAHRYSTEVISADARQLFKELTIGTAKPEPEITALVPHHFINSHSIYDSFDVARYENDALTLIEQRFREKSILILCGGSGLYVQAVCQGLDDIPPVTDEIRASVRQGYAEHGLTWLQKKMQELDPGHFEVIDKRNPHRLMRALEVRLATGHSISFFQRQKPVPRTFGIIKIGLELDRAELYRRIDERMDKMIDEGLFDEAATLMADRHLPALQTVGYQEIFDHFEGAYDKDETIRLLKRNTRRYAKRQLTWFKRDPEIKWFRPADKELIYEYISHQLRT